MCDTDVCCCLAHPTRRAWKFVGITVTETESYTPLDPDDKMDVRDMLGIFQTFLSFMFNYYAWKALEGHKAQKPIENHQKPILKLYFDSFVACRGIRGAVVCQPVLHCL